MRVLRNNVLAVCFCLTVGVLAGGCFTDSTGAEPSIQDASTNAPAEHGLNDPLRVSDRIRVDFSGSPDPIPSIETEIKGDGTIHLDFVGNVKAEGRTPGQLEQEIQSDYVPKYYTHLNVTVTPAARYFYVEGEILPGGSGGRIVYNGPMTVTRAIAAAGGFNEFANRKKVKLIRVNGKIQIVNCVKALDKPSLDPPVYPGDKVFVPLRRW